MLRNMKKLNKKVMLWMGLLFSTVLLASSSFAEFQDSPMLSVKGSEVYLYAYPEERSEVVTKLAKGEDLIPVAGALGRDERWYMVKTQKGALGWVKSSDVQGADKLERIFKESDSSPPLAVSPKELSASSLENANTVPIEMTGSTIVVPVVLNGSLKTYMLMDTGATYTVVTPRIAKKLSLKLDPHAPRITLITANGPIAAPLGRLASLKVGKAEVHGLVVVVHNFSPSPRIEGLLGLNFLSRFHTSIDSRRQRLILAPR